MMPTEIKIDCGPTNGQPQRLVIACGPDNAELHRDNFNSNSAISRKRFFDQLGERTGCLASIYGAKGREVV